MSAEMCQLLNGNIFCNYFLYYFYSLLEFLFEETNSILKFEIFQPAPFLKHHQYLTVNLTVVPGFAGFLPTAPNI